MVFIVEAFFGGCISKVINDGKDYSWVKIKRAINDKNDQNISTKIYRVIERTFNTVTVKKFKDTDKLYNAIEKIFIEFKHNSDTLESVKCGLGILGIDVSNQRCENFLEKFYVKIRQDDDLYKAVNMTLQQNGIKINQEEFQKLNEKVDKNHTELIDAIASINENLNRKSLIYEENVTIKKIKFQNNKKQNYIKHWNSRLFLHLDNNENPITLSDAFIMPDYIAHKFIKKILLTPNNTALDKVIEQFIECDSSSTLLITGVPGIGKSSIISWIAQKYETDDDCIILRFRDWESEELDEGVFKSICDILECKKRDLNGKVIILDGFDEIKCLDRRDYLIHGFLNDINDFDKIKVIVTSRLFYIDWSSFHNVIELKPFGINKIKKFYHILTGVELNKNKIDTNNLDVLGIPAILYMAIMSDVSINENSTKPELYNRIFAEKGGIFDKFAYEGLGYDTGSHVLRNEENIKEYFLFLRRVAFYMFDENDLSLSKEKCNIPQLRFKGISMNILEFPIKHLFENMVSTIEFIHKSIYEYFVAEHIFSLLFNILSKDEKSVIDLADTLGNLFKSNLLSTEILEFLQYKISNKLNNKFNVVNKAFQLMLRDGMTFYTRKCYKNAIDCEINVFANMLELLHLWQADFLDVEKNIDRYIKYNINYALNLRNMKFENAKWDRVNLTKSNLQNSKLNKAMMENANLTGVNLREADLKGADLRNAVFRNAILTGADLRDAILVGVDLSNADLTYANLQGADLRNADLRWADLMGANLFRVHMEGANIYGTNFENTVMAEFSNSKFSNSKFSDYN